MNISKSFDADRSPASIRNSSYIRPSTTSFLSSSTASMGASVYSFTESFKMNVNIDTGATSSHVHPYPIGIEAQPCDSGVAQHQGRRAYMEDRYVIEKSFLNYAKSSALVDDVRDILPTALFEELPTIMSVYGIIKIIYSLYHLKKVLNILLIL